MKVVATIEFELQEIEDGSNDFNVMDSGLVAARCSSLTECMEFVAEMVNDAIGTAVSVNVVES